MCLNRSCCRLDNLMLVPSSAAARCYGHVSHVTPDTAPRGSHLADKGESAGQAAGADTSLYHLAMQQLPFHPEDEVSLSSIIYVIHLSLYI